MRVVVQTPEQTFEIAAPAGATLREVLLAQGINPHGSVSRRLNCGGRGLCATCGVWLDGDVPEPAHWHDRAAAAYGYPRLSCQIRVDRELHVRLVADKKMWGVLLPAPGRNG